MTRNRVLATLVVTGITAGVVLGGKRSDLDVLARVGAVAAKKVKRAMPPAAAVAGPLAPFKPGDVLPVEERVRVRITGDKAMDGANVTVAPSGGGEVRLGGEVATPTQRDRAVELAKGTVGVERVVDRIAVPE